MKTIYERFAFEIKENINDLSFKFNDNIINKKLKYEELEDNGCNNINKIVEEKNKRDIINSRQNYITAEIIVKEDDLNKDLRIINSSEGIKENVEKEDYYKYNNEEEIKNKLKLMIKKFLLIFLLNLKKLEHLKLNIYLQII